MTSSMTQVPLLDGDIDFSLVFWYNIYQSIFRLRTYEEVNVPNDARSTSKISRRLYLAMVCIWMTLGIVSSAVASRFSEGWDITQWSPILAVGYFVAVIAVALIGTVIATALSNPVTTLTGYVLVAASLGLLLGPMVTQFETASILKVFVLTAVVVVLLGVVSAVIRSDLSPWGLWLLGGLLFVVGGMVIAPLMSVFGLPVEGAMTTIDWISMAVFGGLVILTLDRALNLPYTHGNAMNSAVGMYTSFLGVVIRLSRRPK